MKTVIALFIFSVCLFSNVENHAIERFPDTFMKDNHLAYETIHKTNKVKIIQHKIKTPQKLHNQEMHTATSKKLDKIIHLMQKKHTNQTMKSKTSLYMTSGAKKITNLYLANIGMGFLMNRWINTELSIGMSLYDSNSSMYDISNEYSINLMHSKYMGLNMLAGISVGGFFNKDQSLERHFISYGIGGEMEFIFDKTRIVGSYKFEQLKLEDGKTRNLNIYAIKVKFDFPI